MTKVDGMTASEWVESDKHLIVDQEQPNGEYAAVKFYDHRQIVDGELKPEWPNGKNHRIETEGSA